MSSRWIEHKGKRVLYQDYHGETAEEMLVTLEEAGKLAAASKIPVLSLSNVTNAPVSEAFMKRSKELGKEVFNQKVVRSALIGITGIKSIFLKSYSTLLSVSQPSHLNVFKTEQEALDWLVTESK